MEPINILYTLLFWLATLAIMYRIGLLEGRRHADKILGIEYKKSLHRIKRQADNNQ